MARGRFSFKKGHEIELFPDWRTEETAKLTVRSDVGIHIRNGVPCGKMHWTPHKEGANDCVVVCRDCEESFVVPKQIGLYYAFKTFIESW